MSLPIRPAYGGADFHSYSRQSAFLSHRVLLSERPSSYSGIAVLPILSIMSCPDRAFAACVTFFAGDSYIVRAKMATRRPVRKGSARDVDEGVRLGTEQSAGQRVLGEAAPSDPPKFEGLDERHVARVYALLATRARE